MPTPTNVSSFALAENSRTFSSTTSLEPGRKVSKTKLVIVSPTPENCGSRERIR